MTQYLLRFDDITPEFLSTKFWSDIESILNKNNLKVMLAVIPYCQDKGIYCEGDYLKGIKVLKNLYQEGHMIGMHGCYHRLQKNKAQSLVPLNNYGEFAGKSLKRQYHLIKKSFEWFQEIEIEPKIWIAPAHSFDKNTLICLKRFKINIISDGIFLGPRKRNDFIWIPQQFWKFRKFPLGCMTICIHPKIDDKKIINSLNEFTKKNINNFENPSKIVYSHQGIRRFSLFDQIMQTFCIKLIKFKKIFLKVSY